MRSRVGEIICYTITIHTASSLKLGVPRLSFIGLGSGLSGVAMLILRQQERAAAAQHILVGSFLLVAFIQCLAGLACVGLIAAQSMGPTIVEFDAFALRVRSVARASVVGLGFLNGSCMVGSMKSGLLHSELMVTFNILFIEVHDEVV